MQDYFIDLTASLRSALSGKEVFTAYLEGEDSDFCRFNHARVRQLGSVRQKTILLRLIDGGKQASAKIVVTGQRAEDAARLTSSMQRLRAELPHLPVDPYLLYATDPHSSEMARPNTLAPSRDMIEDIAATASGLDLVGIFCSGGVFRGFANSLGQHNWFETYSFLFDFSLYAHGDKAAKSGYGGFQWSRDALSERLQTGRQHVDALAQAPKSIQPGKYDVYLAPAAVGEVMDLLAWGGFGLKSQRTKQSALLPLVDGRKHLSDKVRIEECTASGIAPNFDDMGFAKPDTEVLIKAGKYHGSLVSARSAKEYDVTPTGADASEMPHSLDMAAGHIHQAEVLQRLGKGIYISNLWYLNYSDRTQGRMTGMTRFATFWVENGKIVAPLNVMRFDENLFHMLGSGLEGLTVEREFMPSASTYEQRQAASKTLPGALVRDIAFTL